VAVAVVKKAAADLFSQVSGADEARARLLFRVLPEYNRDYHDYKSNSPNGLEEYTKYLELTTEEAASIRQAFAAPNDSTNKLRALGYEVDWERWQAIDVAFAGRQFVFVIYANILVEPGDPITIYEL
jgi:hypothetical protein